MKTISILLVDDHALLRQGLRALLQTVPEFAVIGEAENGRQAVQLVDKLKPDIVVMDIAMPQLNGLEATVQICKISPRSKVLIVSSYSDDVYVQKLTEAGAVGYLIKQAAANELIKAIHETYKGNAYFSPAIAKRLLDRYRESFLTGGKAPTRQTIPRLTSREREVLQLVAEGRSNKQMGSDLCISIKTIEKHRQQVMNKLGIHEVAGLTRYALSQGLTESMPQALGDHPEIDAGNRIDGAETPASP